MPLIYLLTYFLLCFLIPTLRIYRKTGINPITFSRSQNAHDLIGLYMKIVMLLSLVAGLESAQLIGFHLEAIFVDSKFNSIGLFLMSTALIWTVVAQYQMSDSWRIGIDEKNKTQLRTKGLFKYSRNPIFLGMLLFQAGIFIYHPTSLFLFILTTSFILITIQVRLEESFLIEQHGEKYREFIKKVPRWIILK